MALLKRNETAADVKEPAAETTAQVTEPVVETAADVKEPAADTATDTKEVATRTSTSMSAAPNGIWYTNDVIQEVVNTAQYGDFPQIIAAQGELTENGTGGKTAGKWIAFRPIQAKVKKVCAPGSQGDEAKEYFAACYEGETTMDGRTIEECLEDAKGAGYDKASIKEYIDLYALVVGQEANDHLVDEVVVMQLSPMSKIEWRKFSKKLEMQAAFGKLQVGEDFTIKAVAKSAKNKSNQNYSHYTFELM